MISSLYNLNKSQSIICHVDDASSALYINDPKKGGGLQKLFYTPPTYLRMNRTLETNVKRIQRDFSGFLLCSKVKNLVN